MSHVYRTDYGYGSEPSSKLGRRARRVHRASQGAFRSFYMHHPILATGLAIGGAYGMYEIGKRTIVGAYNLAGKGVKATARATGRGLSKLVRRKRKRRGRR